MASIKNKSGAIGEPTKDNVRPEVPSITTNTASSNNDLPFAAAVVPGAAAAATATNTADTSVARLPSFNYNSISSSNNNNITLLDEERKLSYDPVFDKPFPVPEELEPMYIEFMPVLMLLWPELFQNHGHDDDDDDDDESTHSNLEKIIVELSAAPILFLEFLIEMGVVDLEGLRVFIPNDDNNEDDDANDCIETLWSEQPCWNVTYGDDEDDEDGDEDENQEKNVSRVPAQVRKFNFFSICMFMSKFGEERFIEMLDNMEAYKMSFFDILTALQDQVMAATFLEKGKIMDKDSRKNSKDAQRVATTNGPPAKKTRRTSPTSVVAQDARGRKGSASHDNNPVDNGGEDSDDGGGKIGAVRDLQKAAWANEEKNGVLYCDD